MCSYAIEPGHDDAFYEPAALRIAPWSSIGFGVPLFVAAAWFCGRHRPGRQARAYAVSMFAAYAVIDVSAVAASGATAAILVIVALSLATKLVGALAGAALAQRHAASPHSALSLSVLVGCLVVSSSSCASPSAAQTQRTGPVVRLAAYNINYGLAQNGIVDEDTLIAIGAPAADVVLLQEVTFEWEQAIRVTFSGDYPHMAFLSRPGPGGLAILSKSPIVEAEELPPVTWFPAQRAVIATPLGRVQVLNVHLRPPFSDDGSLVSGFFATPPIREEEIESFVRALDEALPTVVAGDFNEVDGGVLAALYARGWTNALAATGKKDKTWR